jgi:hypothetical protein
MSCTAIACVIALAPLLEVRMHASTPSLSL